MSKVETLVDFSELDEDLTPEQKKAHAESVEVFLEVLRQDATEAGIKARPLPVRIATRMSSSWSTRRNASPRAAPSSALIAFIASGRLRVIVAM